MKARPGRFLWNGAPAIKSRLYSRRGIVRDYGSRERREHIAAAINTNLCDHFLRRTVRGNNTRRNRVIKVVMQFKQLLSRDDSSQCKALAGARPCTAFSQRCQEVISSKRINFYQKIVDVFTCVPTACGNMKQMKYSFYVKLFLF